MKLENAGEKVFANVNQALAEKIISRSKENSKETEPTSYAHGDSSAVDVYNTTGDDTPQRYSALPFASIVKTTAIIAALLILAALFLGWKERRR